MAAEKPARRDDKPNILWITSEDNGPFLGCYGDPVASTPNLDALASRGVRYVNCYANAPVCAPARSSWIMGIPAVTTGTHHMRSWYRVPQSLEPYPVLLKKAGYYVTNNSKTDYNNSTFSKEIWDECGSEAHFKNRPEGRPFFAVFNIGVSHESGIFEKHYPEKYSEVLTAPDSIEIPPYQVRTPETILDWQRMYDRINDMDSRIGEILTALERSGEEDNTIVFYCSDHGGITLRSKRFIYDSGTRVPFIVYVPDKWRQLAPGEPGTVSERLAQFIDMPRTFLSLTGAGVPDHMPGRIILGEDREPAPEQVLLFSGRFDEAPDMRRGITDGRWKYIRTYEPDRSLYQMIDYPLNQSGQVSQYREYMAGRTNVFQTAQYSPQVPEQLFDTEADPHELNNLAADPAFAGRLDIMRILLDRKLLDARDVGFLPEPMMVRIDRDTGTTLYDFCQDSDTYPLEEILALANMANRQERALIPEFLLKLNDKNPVMRYWAIVGLRTLGSNARPAISGIRAALEDSCEEVRINAAITLGNCSERKEAVSILLAEARKANNDVFANWALDGLRYLGMPEAMEGVSKEEVVRGTYSERTYNHLIGGGTMYRIPGNSDKVKSVSDIEQMKTSNLKPGQIQHMVIFNLPYEEGSEEATRFISDGTQILSAIPVVKDFEAFRQVSPKNSYQYGFSMVFDNQEDYGTYNDHPDHVAFVQERWLKEVTDFLEIDFEGVKNSK